MLRNVRHLLLLAALFTPLGCTAESQEPTATPVATATNAPVVVVVPTATPVAIANAAVNSGALASAPTVTPITVGEAPAAAPPTAPPAAVLPTAMPTATPLPSPTLAPTAAPMRVGLIRFRDNQYSRAGDFIVLSNNLPIAPAGSHYDLWLTKDGGPLFRLGQLPSQQTELNYTDSADQNLLAIYDGALLSLESDLTTPGEIGPTVIQGVLPLGPLPYIRAIADRYADNPEGQGFLIGATGQLQLAREHTGFLREALATNNQPEARRHAEHVLNIINSQESELFGDLDGDKMLQNPGDGVGVIGYLLGTKEQADRAAKSADATAEVKLHAGHVLVSSDNMLGWLGEANEQALRVLAADSAAEALPAAEPLAALLDQAYNGVDANNDGVVLPIPGEGGLLAAYEHTLNMGTIELYPTGDSASKPEGVVAAPPPAPTADQPPAEAANPHDHSAPTPVIIEISNFAYTPAQLTIKPGTTVTWVNQDSAQHSATADDGSFDTGLFAPGASASVTFEQPGTYPYYCQLHGGAGGQGMAGVIVVSE